MKNKTLVLLITLFVVVLASAAPNAVFASEQKSSTVSVTGHAEATVVPDVAIITTGIVTVGDDVESARKSNNQTMRKIINALIGCGIDRKNITTSQFSLQPIYVNDEKNGTENKIKGYRLENSVAIAVEDMSKIGIVIDKAFEAGANQFQGLKFSLKDDSALKDELLKKAILDGKRKAGLVAQTMAMNLGVPQSVSISGYSYPLQEDGYRLLKSAGATPIEAGTLTVSMNADMVFNLEK